MIDRHISTHRQQYYKTTLKNGIAANYNTLERHYCELQYSTTSYNILERHYGELQRHYSALQRHYLARPCVSWIHLLRPTGIGSSKFKLISSVNEWEGFNSMKKQDR